jgi:mannose-6-phosphate isomerase-like protein (cupin superfamily)
MKLDFEGADMDMTTTLKTSADLKTSKGKNYTAVEAGPFKRLNEYQFHHPKVARKVTGKLFLKEALGLTGAEISLNRFPPGLAMPFLHKHRQSEEIYIFTSGQGQFLVDGDIIDVSEGSVVRVAPDAERAWRNTSANQDLHYICIQVKDGSFDIVDIEDGVPVEAPPVWSK